MLQHQIKDESGYFHPHNNPITNTVGITDQHGREMQSTYVTALGQNLGSIPAVAGAISPLQSKNISSSLQQIHQQQQQQQQQAAININNSSLTKSIPSDGRSTPSNHGGNTSEAAAGKLFVGGLSWQTSAEKLKEYFNMFGTVTDVLIMKDPVTQRSRGFCFITFQDPSCVDKVLKVPIHTLDGKKIDPKHATPKNRPRQSDKTKKIFVGGVSQDTSAEEVKAYFGQFGNVEETVMLMDQQTKRHRGFGFVTFENEDVVDRVCDIHFHVIKNKKVECKKAQSKAAGNPAAQLLQKRLMLGSLGGRLPGPAGQLFVGGQGPPGMAQAVAGVNPLAILQSQQAAQAYAAQAAAIMKNPFSVQNSAALAANPGYGKLLATYPSASGLQNLRYAPYPVPASAVATQQYQQHQQHQQFQQHQQYQQHQQHQLHQQHHQQQQQNAAAIQHTAANQPSKHVAVAASSAAQAANSAASVAAEQQGALVAFNPINAQAAAAVAVGNPYQNYALPNVDMSSFQGVDWGALYGGMGMYV